MTVLYLSVEHVLALHDISIQEFGGIFGLRDKGLLESAVLQPMQSFGDQDLYPTLFDKAAAYAFFISENQPFLDGNKRTAISTAAVFLDLNGYGLKSASGTVYEVMMDVSNKRMDKDQLAHWFRKNSKKNKK